MRALFSLAGLLIVIAVIAMLARHQLGALGVGSSARSATAVSPAAQDGSVAPTTVPEQARSLQQKTQTDVMKALESGVQQRASSPQ